jgi:hypothetical protein
MGTLVAVAETDYSRRLTALNPSKTVDLTTLDVQDLRRFVWLETGTARVTTRKG